MAIPPAPPYPHTGSLGNTFSHITLDIVVGRAEGGRGSLGREG